MPVVFLDRIPLPNLRLYSAISIALLSCSIYYAAVTTSDPDWRLLSAPPAANAADGQPAATAALVSQATEGPCNASDSLGACNRTTLPAAEAPEEGDIPRAATLLMDLLQRDVQPQQVDVDTKWNATSTEDRVAAPSSGAAGESADAQSEAGRSRRQSHLWDVGAFMCQEAVCIWTLINMAYCCLILLGKSIQKVVFGELRISEQQHLKDKFWNFVFYKFIFVFGVVNVQFMHEVVMWVAWFSILGFLHLLSQLCKDRFEYLSFSPTTPGWSHVRLLTLLSSILTMSGIMSLICVWVGTVAGLNMFAFMAAECILLMLRTLHVLIRYTMFLYDMREGGALGTATATELVSWEKRGPLAYYVELAFDVSMLAIDLAHHMHMLLWSNVFLSMASLVIVMHLRFLSHEIQRKFKKHRNYLWVLNYMERTYPLATFEDLSLNADNCAICLERMETARKLPCKHLFHNSCLQSWLEQDPSCPTCRLALSVHQPPNVSNTIRPADIDPRIEEPALMARAPRARANHFFQFNGSRYVSWLPTLSVEVTHNNTLFRGGWPVQPAAVVPPTSQVRNMALQVQQMFATYPISVIIADLQVSRSMEVTIGNILEGRLQVPDTFQPDDEFVAELAGEGGAAAPAAAAPLNAPLPTSMISVAAASSDAPTSRDIAAVASTSSVNAGLSLASTSTAAAAADTAEPEARSLVPTSSSSVANAVGGVVESSLSTSDDSESGEWLDIGYEIELSNSNIFGNQTELLRDENLEDRYTSTNATLALAIALYEADEQVRRQRRRRRRNV